MSAEINTSAENLPLFMTAHEVWEKIIGKERLGENHLYKLLNLPGCPRVACGKKYLYPTLKLIDWIENETLGSER